MKKKSLALSVSILLAIFLSSCASIVSKSNWPVNVQTNPTGAKCSISKTGGTSMHTGEAPITLNLDSSRGFFLPGQYTITCSKDGYQTASSEISANLNMWYFGNILLGGAIGMLIVDPATGAMWKLDGTPIVITLAEDASALNKDSSQRLVTGDFAK